MKCSQHSNSFLQKDWQGVEIGKCSPELLPYDIESQCNSSGVLSWNILEDRIYMSEGLYRLLGMSEVGVRGLKFWFWWDPECEMRQYLRKILDQVCSSELEDTTFKTKIPGSDKEIYGSVQLLDMEEIGILDLMLVCWEED